MKAEGYEVAVAFDGLHGTKLAHKYGPDLIILDLMLPAGGGFGVLDNVKASMETFHIPVVVYSAFKDDERRKTAMQKGAVAYFDKTCDLAELAATIKDILASKEKDNT